MAVVPLSSILHKWCQVIWYLITGEYQPFYNMYVPVLSPRRGIEATKTFLTIYVVFTCSRGRTMKSTYPPSPPSSTLGGLDSVLCGYVTARLCFGRRSL